MCAWVEACLCHGPMPGASTDTATADLPPGEHPALGFQMCACVEECLCMAPSMTHTQPLQQPPTRGPGSRWMAPPLATLNGRWTRTPEPCQEPDTPPSRPWHTHTPLPRPGAQHREGRPGWGARLADALPGPGPAAAGEADALCGRPAEHAVHGSGAQASREGSQAPSQPACFRVRARAPLQWVHPRAPCQPAITSSHRTSAVCASKRRGRLCVAIREGG